MQGLHRMIAIDAYNGSIHWSLEIPDFERFNVPRDCSNWCADETHVFAAIRDRCWKIDATNGNVDTTLTVLPGKNEEWQCDWGYVARVDDHLVGTAVKQGTAYTEFFGGGGAGWYDSKSGDITKKVCSDNLFVLDVATGEPRWQNNDDGLIVNPTITIADGTIFYAACRDADLIAGKERRLNSPAFWKNLVLVARNLKTGEKQWEKPLDGIVPGTVVLYMAHTDGRLVLVASHNGDNKYHTYAIDAADGKPLWDVHFPWPSDNHGKHMSRPAIAHGKVFVRPKVIDLTTGKMLEQPMPDGGCGTYALTDEMAIYRAGNVTLWNPESDKVTSWNRLRPGCWLSTIPANGMLLSPEAGGGCSCGNWMETSIGFGPKRKQ